MVDDIALKADRMALFTTSKMTHKVVLDADWFMIEGERYFKIISYFAPTLGLFGEVSFSLPPSAAFHKLDLAIQAKKSHGLDWRTPGFFRHDEVCRAVDVINARLGHAHLEFFSKGLEKAKLLEPYFKTVTDLNATGCPRFETLCSYKRTTLQKAITFGQWLQFSE